MTYLLDTTLREGEQTVGINFSLEQKKKIIDGLAQVGVAELELGIASPLAPDLTEITTYCRKHHPELRTSLWTRCKDDDILYAASLAPDCLSLSIPVSDILLNKKLGKDRNWALKVLESAISIASSKDIKISVGFEDATRADTSFLIDLAALARHAGAFRIRIADTVGVATPSKITSLVKILKRSVNVCEIGVHTHNDFGMATANAITAIETGADMADVTILGLGERTGCARLEEVGGYLGIMGNCPRLKVEQMKPLAKYVSKITGRSIEESRPLLGEKIFTCETGLHLHGLQMDHSTYEPFPPERIGASRHLVFGTKCGRKALRMKLADLGIDLTEDIPLNKVRFFRQQTLLNPAMNEKEILDMVSPPL